LTGSALPAVEPPNRPAVGLALEGGGALGMAHVGVLQWFEEHRIPVDRISGTSMGALVGGLYASGQSPAQLREIAMSDAFTRVFTLQTPYSEASFRRRQDRHEVPGALTVGLHRLPHLRNALFTDLGVNEFLTVHMPAYNGEDLDFNWLPIPFRCVATDLNTLKSVTFGAGPLPEAIRASISIPGVFPPVQDHNGHYLVDGGILDNLPTDVLRSDLHADIVIAVHLENSPSSTPDTSTIVGILNRAFAAGIAMNVEQAQRLADVVIRVPIAGFSPTDYAKPKELIDAGYQAAEKSRDALLPYALDEQAWKIYQAARESRSARQRGAFRQVRVVGGGPETQQAVERELKPLEGEIVSPAATLKALERFQSNGGYSATYETFGMGAAGEDGILVHVTKDPTGPPFLMIAPEIAAVTSNVTRQEVTLRMIDQNLGGFGSELRANARVGYMTNLSAEYYRLVSPGGFFVEPQVRLVREPVYLWADQKRVAERFRESLDGGIEAGRTFSSRLQVSADWRAEDTHWSLVTGSGGGPYLSGTAQTGLLHITLDENVAGVFSPSGFRISAAAGALYHAAGSDNAPLVKLTFSRSRPWNNNSNNFSTSVEINSYLRANVAQPYRFTLGGPMRLSASSIDEYRGTDTFLARAGYLHRIAALPTGLGQGLYAVVGYEAGEVWSPEARAILRQDGTTGLIANTPVGLVTFGMSVGDAGHRKVFVTLGRWF
jgi:NTE family protein